MAESQEPIPMLDLTPEVEALWDEVHEAVDRVLRSGHFILGPEVEAFEAEAAGYLGVKHAIGLNSGTDALVIGLRALGIGPGDEVITTAYSFFATAEAIGLVGATPVFVDIDPDTLNLDPDGVEAAIDDRTKAILPVHLFGLPAEMDCIMDIANARGVKVLEDCAQAFGATIRIGSNVEAMGVVPSGDGTHHERSTPAGRSDPTIPATERRVGSIGHAAAFSFYPTKNLGAYGDGGMLTTNDDAVARAARMLRGHGSPPAARYTHEALGYNSRLDELQAAILRIKLRRVDADNRARRDIAARYRERLGGRHGIDAPGPEPGHVFHQFALRLPAIHRDRVQAALTAEGIATAAFYPSTLAEAYGSATGAEFDVPPNAADASRRVLNLPIWPGLSVEQIDRIAAAVLAAFDPVGRS